MHGNMFGALTLGATQHHNTARKIGKYRNTVSKIDEITMPYIDPFIIDHAHLNSVKQILARMYELYIL